VTGRSLDVGERLLAIGVRDIFNLVEPGQCIADVIGIDEGLLPLLGKGEGAVR
jgi:hypothetical protein